MRQEASSPVSSPPRKRPRLLITTLVRGFTILLTTICILLSVICASVLLQNLLHPERPPTLFGATLAVMTNDSMEGVKDGCIPYASLISIGKVDAKSLREGDVIAFYEDQTLYIGRIQHIADSPEFSCTAKADRLNATYPYTITEDTLIGTVQKQYDTLGTLSLFLLTPIGALAFCGVPAAILLGIVAYDAISALQLKKRKNTPEANEKENLS